jgi:hypothetical protein
MAALPVAACLGDGGMDIAVGPAATQVAAHRLAYPGIVGGGMRILEQCHGGHDLSRATVAALVGVMGEKCRLNRVKLSVFRQPFDGGDRLPLAHHRQAQTGIHRAAIDVHRTGAALAMVTALLGTTELQLIAQHIKQDGLRRDVEGDRFTVQGQPDGKGCVGRREGRLHCQLLVGYRHRRRERSGQGAEC